MACFLPTLRRLRAFARFYFAGAMHSGESRSGLLTRFDTAYAVMCEAGYGLSTSSSAKGSDSPGSSQRSYAAGFRITGIRSWIFSINELGVVVMITHDKSVLSSGARQASHSPAKAKGVRLLSRMYIGVLPWPPGSLRHS